MVEIKTFTSGLQPLMPLYRHIKSPKQAAVGAQYLVPEHAVGNQAKKLCSLLTLQPSQAGTYGNSEQPYEVFDRTAAVFAVTSSIENDAVTKKSSVETKCLLIPRCIGLAQFGTPDTDTRADGAAINAAAQFTAQLFDWQRQIVDHAETRIRAPPYYGGVIQASCGLGKTMLAISLAMRLRVKVAVAVNKEFLATQWLDRVANFTTDMSVGRVQGDKCEVADFTVVMLQTVASGRYPPLTFDDIGFLIVDEVHHLPARTFSQVAKYFRAKMTLGLSATLQRGDGNERCVFWQLGPLLATAQRTTTCAQMNVTVKIVQGIKSIEPTRSGRLDRVLIISHLVAHRVRNNILNEQLKLAIDQGYNVLVISERIDQLNRLTDLLAQDAKYPAPLKYIGERTQSRRKDRDHGLLQNPRVVMTTKQMAAEAFDWKDCTAVLLATPVPVGSVLEQIVGRCQRNGNTVDERPRLIIDIADTSFALASMARSRVAWYDKKAYTILCDSPLASAVLP